MPTTDRHSKKLILSVSTNRDLLLKPSSLIYFSRGFIMATLPTTTAAANTVKFADTLDITTLTADQISKFTEKDFAAFSTQQQVDLTAQQVSLLTAKQLVALPFKLLEPNTITGIQPKVLAALDLKTLSADQFAALLPEQTQALTPAQITNLTTTQVDALAPEQTVVFTSTQVAALTDKSLKVLSEFALEALTTDAIKGLTAANIVGLTTDAIKILTTDQVAVLNSTQVQALTPALVKEMEAEDITALKVDAVKGFNLKAIPSLEILALTPEQLGALTPKQISTFTPTQLGLLDENYSPVITGRVLNLLTPNQVAALSTAVVTALDPLAVKGFTVKNIKGLTTDQLSVITPEQGGNLSRSQLSSLDATKVSALPSDVIVTLKPQILKGLPVSIVAQLSSAAFAAFSGEQISGLSSQQIAGLTTAQAASLTSDHIQKFTPTAFKNLSDASISALSASALSGLTSKQITGLSAAQLEKMTPAQVAQFAQELKDWAVTTRRYATVESAETAIATAQGIKTGGTVTGTARAETITSGAGADTITYTGSVTAGDKITTGAGNDTITVSKPTTGNHIIDAGIGTDSLTFNDATPTLTSVTGVELVTLANTGTQSFDAGNGTSNALTSLTATAIADDATLTLTGSVASLPVSLTNADLAASGYTARLNVTASGTSAKTLTTGSGNDSVTSGNGNNTITTNAGNDTIVAGTGSDTIDAGSGADVMTGGITGNNTFVFSSASNGGVASVLAADGFDTITDFKAGDVIDFGATNLFTERNALTATTSAAKISQTGKATFHANTTSLADKITAVEGGIELGATTPGASMAGEAALFEHGSDSYLFISDSIAGVGANDVLVKLSGITSAAGTAKGIVVASGDITSLTGYAADYNTSNFGTLTNVDVMGTAASIQSAIGVAAAGHNLMQAIADGQIRSITASDGAAIQLTPAQFATTGLAALLDTGSVTISGALSANPSAAYTAQHDALITNRAKIADGGILAATTGLTLTPADFNTLDDKLFRHANTPASSTKVTIDATTVVATSDLANISTYIQNVVDSAGITNLSTPAVDATVTNTVVNNLLSKATGANVVATRPGAEAAIDTQAFLTSLITYKANIAAGGSSVGITGTIPSLTATQFKDLGSHIADSTTAPVTITTAEAAVAANVSAIVTDVANISGITTSDSAKITLTPANFLLVNSKLANSMGIVDASGGATSTHLAGIATGDTKVYSITGLALNLSDVGDADTLTILNKATSASVVATSGTATEVGHLVTKVANIVNNGITGTISVADTQFTTLVTKLNTSADVTVSVSGTTHSSNAGADKTAILANLSKIDAFTGSGFVVTAADFVTNYGVANSFVSKLVSSGIAVVLDAASASTANLKTLSDVISSTPSVVSSITGLNLDLTTDYAGNGHASTANDTVTTNLLSKATAASVTVSVTGGETAAELIALSTYSGNISTISNSSNTVTAAEFVASEANLPTGVVVNAANATADDLRGIVNLNSTKLGSIKNLTVNITAGTAATAATDANYLLGKSQNGDARVNATWIDTTTLGHLVTHVNKIRDGGITGNGLTMTASQFSTLGAKINSSISDMIIDASTGTPSQATLASVSSYASRVALINNLSIDLGDVSITNAVTQNLMSRAATGTNAANVTVTGATSTELNTVATYIDNVKTGVQGTAGILGTLAVDQNIPTANITALFSKNAALASPVSTANISGMTQAQIAAVVAQEAKLAASGISGSVTGMNAAQLTALVAGADQAKIAATLSGVLALDSGVASGDITKLHAKYAGTSATANISGMSAAQITVLDNTDIATGGITGSVTGFDNAALTALAGKSTDIADGSLTGVLAIDSNVSAANTITLFNKYGGTSATANTSGMTGDSGAKLAAVAGGVAKIAAGGITNLTSTNFNLSDTNITGSVAANLLSKAPTGVVTVTATGADTTEIAALSDNYTKLAIGSGIDGTTSTLVFTDTQFGNIYNRLAAGKTVTVDAEGATTAELQVISDNASKVTAVGLNNLTLTSAQTEAPGNTQITNLLTLAPTATATAKIAATNMSAAQLSAVATLSSHVALAGITGAMAITKDTDVAALNGTGITALFSKYSGTTATAVVTSMSAAQIAALDNNGIISGGITGSLTGLSSTAIDNLITKMTDVSASTLTGDVSVSNSQYTSLAAKLAGSVNIIATNTAQTTDALSAMDAATSGYVNAAAATSLSGSASAINTIMTNVVAAGSIAGNKFVLGSGSGAATTNVQFTLSDTGSVAATTLSGLDGKTTGFISATGVTGVTGSINEVTAVFGTSGANLDSTITNNKFAIGTAGSTTTNATVTLNDVGSVAATGLSNLNAGTSGLITAASVTTLTGLAAEIKAVTDAMASSGDKIALAGLTTLQPSDAISAADFDSTAFTQASITITLADVASNALTVAGGTVTAGNTLVVNGGSLTGANALTFIAAATEDGKYNVTGGAAADTFKFADVGSTLTTNHTINGGGGTDIVEITAADTTISGADFANVSAVEVLKLTGASSVQNFTNANAANFTTVVTGNDNTSITSTKTALTVNAGNVATTKTLTLLGSTNYTVNNDDGTGTITGTAFDTLTATGSTGTINATFGNVGNGTNAVTFAAGSGNVTVVGGDAGDTVTVTGLTTASQTFTGSVANFDITAGAGAQTIATDVGADTITGGTGADIINVGSGTDTVKVTATGQTFSGSGITSGSTVLTGIDQVTGMAASDIVDLSGLLNTFTGAAGTTLASATGTTVALVRGGFNTGTSVWTDNGVGADTLLVYDADGAGAGTTLEAIVLIGSGAAVAGGTAAAGVLTLS